MEDMTLDDLTRDRPEPLMVSEVAACSDVPSDEAGGMAPFQNDEFLRAYQELMNAVVGPLPFRKDKDKYLDGRDNQQVENSEPDGVDGVEGAAQRHTVSGAKRRKMDKKKLKKEESRKFPSIVDFRLLSRVVKPISLLPPPQPLFTTINPSHVPLTDDQLSKLRDRVRSCAVEAEDVKPLSGAPRGYGPILPTVRPVYQKTQPAPQSDAWKDLPSLLITERTKRPSSNAKSAATSQPPAKLKQHHPDPVSHTSCVVLPVRLLSSLGLRSKRPSVSHLVQAVQEATTKAEKRKATRLLRMRHDVAWRKKRIQRKKSKRKETTAGTRPSV